MELSTLKKYRKIVPGTAFLFFLIPAYQYFSNHVFKIEEALKFTIEGYGAVLAFVIGTFFSSLKIRSLRNASTHASIDDNIKTRLIENGLTKEVGEEELARVKSGKDLMYVYYHLIDNDESLKEKSKLVRDNGLVWTSTADVAILGCFFTWLYFLLILIFGPELLLVFAGLLVGCLGLLSGAVLHPMTVKSHIELCNEQINFIIANHKEKLQEKVNGLFE